MKEFNFPLKERQLKLFESPFTEEIQVNTTKSHLRNKEKTPVKALKSDLVDLSQVKIDHNSSFFLSHSNEESFDIVQNFLKIDNGRLLLIGGIGVGKTHLLNMAAKKLPKSKTLFLNGRDFKQQLFEAEIKGHLMKLKSYIKKNIHYILLDDLDECLEQDKFLLELCDLIDVFFSQGKSLFFTLKKNPSQYRKIPPKLIARLQMFYLQEIQDFDQGLAMKYLHFLEQKNKAHLSQGIRNYLIDSFGKNAFSLESAYNNLSSLGPQRKIEMDIEKVQSILLPLSRPKVQQKRAKVHADQLLEIASQYFKISKEEILSKCRKGKLTTPRHLIMYAFRNHYQLSLLDIGKIFNMHHASILHGIRKVEHDLSQSEEIRPILNKLIETLEKKLILS